METLLIIRNFNSIHKIISSLDFDNKDPKKKLAFEEVRERAVQYELPILFAYESSVSSR